MMDLIRTLKSNDANGTYVINGVKIVITQDEHFFPHGLRKLLNPTFKFVTLYYVRPHAKPGDVTARSFLFPNGNPDFAYRNGKLEAVGDHIEVELTEQYMGEDVTEVETWSAEEEDYEWFVMNSKMTFKKCGEIICDDHSCGCLFHYNNGNVVTEFGARANLANHEFIEAARSLCK